MRVCVCDVDLHSGSINDLAPISPNEILKKPPAARMNQCFVSQGPRKMLVQLHIYLENEASIRASLHFPVLYSVHWCARAPCASDSEKMPIIDSVASNVESTLAFNLSVRLVDILSGLKGGKLLLSDPRDSTIFLCVGILFISAAPSFLFRGDYPMPSSARDPKISVRGWSSSVRDLFRSLMVVTADAMALVGHVLVLSFSRIAMQQVRLSRFDVDPKTAVPVAVFMYSQRIAEIMFVGIALSCCLTTFLPGMDRLFVPGGSQRTGIDALRKSQVPSESASLLGKQVKSLVVNMQRTFAETVTTVIPDSQTRKMIILLGLCMLPSIARSTSPVQTSPYSSYSSITLESVKSFLMMNMDARHGVSEHANASKRRWSMYTTVLAKIWITGLSTAWINMAIGFILPQQNSDQQDANGSILAIQRWIGVVSTGSLAIMTAALSHLFPGWSVVIFPL